MDLNQIVTLLNQVMDAIQTLEKDSTQADMDNAGAKSILLAKQYPIRGHCLVDKSDFEKKLYIGCLLAFCNSGLNKSMEENKIYHICRIIASYEQNIDLTEYIAQSLKINMKTMQSMIETFDSETILCFSVDMLILYMLEPNNIRRNSYETISDIFQFLQMSKNDVRKAAQIAKCIIEQDFEGLIGEISEKDSINYNCFLGYFPDNKYTTIVSSFVDIQHLEGNVLVANAQISNCHEYFDLSETVATSITFRNCVFVNIKGFRENEQLVIFDGCKFENNNFDTEDYVLIQGQNILMINTVFTDIHTSKNILNISDGKIRECKFVNCQGVDLPCTYLFELNNVEVSKCIFDNCTMVTIHHFRQYTTGGVFTIANGFVRECIFDKCIARGEATSHEQYATFEMQIVKAINTTVGENKFNNCCCYSDISRVVNVKSYILGLKNSNENGNEFNECSSHHYIDGGIRSNYKNYNIGEL